MAEPRTVHLAIQPLLASQISTASPTPEPRSLLVETAPLLGSMFGVPALAEPAPGAEAYAGPVVGSVNSEKLPLPNSALALETTAISHS